MGLGEDEFKQRKDYLELQDSDIELLRKFAEPLREIHPVVMDEFYNRVQAFPATRDYLHESSLVQRLRKKQADYFSDLLNGNFDRTYLENRLKLGLTHQQVGLPTNLYIGGYAKFLITLIPKLTALVSNDLDTLINIVLALMKVIFLDVNLVLDTYACVDKLEIQALKDYSEKLVCNIPLGLIVVSRDLHIISSNQYIDDQFGISHIIMKDTLLTRYFPGSGLHDRANEVLSTGKSQVGVQLEIQNSKHSLIHCEVSLTPLNMELANADNATQPALLITLEDLTERDILINNTRAYDNRVRAILDNVAESIITIDQNGIIESFNPAAEKLFGYTANEVIGRNIKLLMPSPYKEKHDDFLQEYARTLERHCLDKGYREVEGLRKDKTTFSIDLSISELMLPDKKMYIGMIRDISQRKRSEAEMAKLSLAIEQTADMVVITDADGVIEYVNCGFENTTGYQRDQAIGNRPSILKSGLQKPSFYKTLWQQLKNGMVYQDIFINRKKNGDLYYEEKTITPLRNTRGDITHYISTGKDITERMHTQKRLQFLAHHDILTSLPNRLLFKDRISHAISQANRHKNKFALLFLDLDRFKKINDSLGHNIGDKLLQKVSVRLQQILRKDDTVSRLSGDEFAILLSDIAHADNILPIIKKIIQQFNNPFTIDERELFVSTSIGISIYPDDGDNPDALLKNADTAMYAAKRLSPGDFSFYTADMNSMASIHLQLENDLRYALQRKQFILVYQPQFSSKDTSSVIGAEVLLRWQHPKHGLLIPEKFIPLLEDTGMIKQVGEWVIHESCRQLREWHDAGFPLPRLAINIAPHQLNPGKLVDTILSSLEEYNLSPNCIELEITESSLLQNERRSIEILKTLNSRGIYIAMDDFGTGYSSLSYLQRLPINTLKIDRSFINHIPNVNEDCALTRAIIAMGCSLNLHIIAEGVETNEQLEFLRKLGCNGVQGYLLAHPMVASELQDSLTPLFKQKH